MTKENKKIKNENDLGKAMNETITFNNLDSTLQPFAEFALDMFLKDGVLRDLPVFGAITTIIKGGIALRDLSFVKKIFRFLKEIETVPDRERQEMIEKLEDDNKYQCMTGDALMLMIEKFEHPQKASMLGRVFKSFASQDISQTQLFALSSAISHVDIQNLSYLSQYYSDKSEKPTMDHLQNLFVAGLVGVDFGSGAIAGGASGRYKRNELGDLFIRTILDPDHKRTPK